MKIKYLLFIPALLLVGCKGSDPAPTTYKVVYDANGGSFASGTIIEVTAEANKPINELEEAPTHSKGYLFGDWYENKEGAGKSFDFSTNIIQDITLYARWLNNSGIDTDFDGLADTIDPAPNDNTYTSHLIEIYPPIHIVDMPITVDYRRFLKDENEFDKDLEQLGNVCAMDIYKVSTTTLNGPSNIYEPITGDDDDKLYLQLGCTDIEITTFNPDQYAIDKFDTYRCLLAHHRFDYDNKVYEVLYITNQGTDSEAEWYSDFDVGIDNEDYASVTGVAVGKHTHWINNGLNGTPTHHKGFDIASNREFNDVIAPYIDKYIDKDANLIIFNTGHSRGAAIANLLGKKFQDKKKELNIYKSFTYTYATPTVVYNTEGNVDCPGVHNILNGDDIVPMLPLTSWGYHRYGVDHSEKISGGHEQEWKEFNNTIFSYEGPDYENLTQKMYNMAQSMSVVYKPHTDTEDTLFSNNTYTNEQEADEAIKNWRTTADFWYGRNTLDFVKSEDQVDGITVKGYNRPVSLMARLSVVVGNVNEGNLERLQQMLGDKTLCDNYQLIEYEFLLNGAKLLTAHRGTSYYFISAKLIK